MRFEIEGLRGIWIRDVSQRLQFLNLQFYNSTRLKMMRMSEGDLAKVSGNGNCGRNGIGRGEL